MPSRPGNIQSRITKSKLSRLSRKKPSSPVFAVSDSKPSLRNPLARARAVLASSSINKTLTHKNVRSLPHHAKMDILKKTSEFLKCSASRARCLLTYERGCESAFERKGTKVHYKRSVVPSFPVTDAC